MAANKYVAPRSGLLTGNCGNWLLSLPALAMQTRFVALDSTGRLDQSVMPVGIVPETKSLVTSENLSAGNFVKHLQQLGGVATARKSDA